MSISKQASLTTSSINKLNLRLVRILQYLLFFDLTVKYKAGKTNIIPDTLFRLKDKPTPENITGILDALHASIVAEVYSKEAFGKDSNKDLNPSVFHVTLIKISDTFK